MRGFLEKEGLTQIGQVNCVKLLSSLGVELALPVRPLSTPSVGSAL